MSADHDIVGYGRALIEDGQEFRELAANLLHKLNQYGVLDGLAQPGNFGGGAGETAGKQFRSFFTPLMTEVGDYPDQLRNVGIALGGAGAAVLKTGEDNRRTADSLASGIAGGRPVDLGSLGDSNVPNVPGVGTNQGDHGGGDGGGTGTGGRR